TVGRNALPTNTACRGRSRPQATCLFQRFHAAKRETAFPPPRSGGCRCGRSSRSGGTGALGIDEQFRVQTKANPFQSHVSAPPKQVDAVLPDFVLTFTHLAARGRPPAACPPAPSAPARPPPPPSASGCCTRARRNTPAAPPAVCGRRPAPAAWPGGGTAARR